MTIQDVLNTVNVMYPNTYDNDDKIKMISTLDMLTNEEVFRQYLDGDYIEDFKGYKDKPLTTKLLIKEPYAEDVYMYKHKSHLITEKQLIIVMQWLCSIMLIKVIR